MRLIVPSVRKLLPTLLDDEDASFENDSDSGYQGSCDGYLIGADGNGFPTLVCNCWTADGRMALSAAELNKSQAIFCSQYLLSIFFVKTIVLRTLLHMELPAMVLVNHVWQMVVGVLVKCYKPRDLRDLRLSTLTVVGEPLWKTSLYAYRVMYWATVRCRRLID